MSVNFVARKCACGGKLEFDSVKKIWICKYCGTVVEREATFDKIHVDGIEGISDVVRQTLMDVANQKMDSASRNLEDCERKNHKHVGTLLANLSFNLANISFAKSQDEARASLDKVKIYAKKLQEDFPVIAEDEINLYEAFGEGLADIFATLLVIFDTLGDLGRVEYVSSKLIPQEVFSPYANKSLLKISIKQGKVDVVDEIVSNIGHIDRKSSLQEILDHYPDNERKAGLVEKLFDVKVADALSKKYFEEYFTNSNDSIETKTALIEKLSTTEVHCNAETIVKALHHQMDSYEVAKKAFSALYTVKISDQETEALLVFCLMVNKSFDVQAAFFDALLERKVFVALNGKSLISFLDSSTFLADERVEILQRMLNFQMDGKALDAVYNYYLNNNGDEVDTRVKIIKVLLQNGSPISTNTVKNYVVKTQTDGDRKTEVIDRIFATGINKTYLGDLLSEYLLQADDSEKLKETISEYLINLGFKVDSNVLTQYIASSQDETSLKIAKVKKLISNGTQVKADCLDNYILSLKNRGDFSEEMFDLLTNHNYTVGFQAYTKFALFCKDMDKIRHNEKMAHALTGDISSQSTSITHNGNNVVCNLFQAYVLNTTDSYDVAKSITNEFVALRMKLNTEISVGCSIIKFKKYIGEHKSELSPLALQLCEENKMFSLF